MSNEWNNDNDVTFTAREVAIIAAKAIIAAPVVWGLVWLLCAIGNAYYM